MGKRVPGGGPSFPLKSSAGGGEKGRRWGGGGGRGETMREAPEVGAERVERSPGSPELDFLRPKQFGRCESGGISV